MIDSPAALERLARSLDAVPAIALDSEGDGLYRYRARLCTIQLAHPAAIALVDTLAFSDFRALAPVLGPEGPEKVLHDCAFDARMLARAGLPIARVFDTAVAARFLGEVSTGLSSLLEKHLGVRIEKDLQQADWGKRPLDDVERAYLEEDVRHLLALAAMLRDRCTELDILDEVQVESAWAAACGSAPEEEPGPAWLRVKGAGELRNGTHRSVLRELAALRERVAEEEDVPPFRVLPNQALIAIARKAPRDRAGLAPFGALARRPDLERAVLDAVKLGLDAKDAPADELTLLHPPAPPPQQRELRKRRESALSAWRTKVAEERGVGIQVVLPGHCMRELAARSARDEAELLAVPGFGERRVERYGGALLALLASIV